jgi:hypothetical protein
VDAIVLPRRFQRLAQITTSLAASVKDKGILLWQAPRLMKSIRRGIKQPVMCRPGGPGAGFVFRRIVFLFIKNKISQKPLSRSYRLSAIASSGRVLHHWASRVNARFYRKLTQNGGTYGQYRWDRRQPL